MVKVDGRERTTAELGGTRPRQILEMLAVNLGSPVSKDRIAEDLWEGMPPATYRATLESYVCVLRRGLGVGRGRRSEISTTHRGYVLDPARVRVDVIEVRRLLKAASDGRRRLTVATVERALSKISGELLEDEAYVGWAGRERESFAELLATACTDAASVANDLGLSDVAVRLARTATQQGTIREGAWQALMTGLWRSGHEAEALAAYADLRSRTLEELGVEPGRRTEALYLEILRGDGARAERPPGLEVVTLIRLLHQVLAADSDARRVFESTLRDAPRSATV